MAKAGGLWMSQPGELSSFWAYYYQSICVSPFLVILGALTHLSNYNGIDCFLDHV